ncbi:MAG: hypothetical protein FJZ95_11320 [Chloroflexi bacterium]|nr:hypothetical protein [Chloroflexota bacterium]
MSFDEELEVFKKESGEALGTTVVNYEHFNLRGYEAIRMETIDHIYDQNGQAIQIVHLSVSADKGMDRYMIQLACLLAEVDQYRAIFNLAVDTFDIVK